VVAVYVVDAAAIDIDLGSDLLKYHRRILNIPCRATHSDFRLPRYSAFFVFLVSVPEYEVPAIPPIAIVGIFLEAYLRRGPFAHIETVEFAESVEREWIEEDIAFKPIGVSGCKKCLDYLDCLVDARRRARNFGRQPNAEKFSLLEKVTMDLIRNIFDLASLVLGLHNRLVFDVGEVDYAAHIETQIGEISHNDVFVQERPVIPNVGSEIGRRSARKDRCLPRAGRSKLLNRTRHCVIQVESGVHVMGS